MGFKLGSEKGLQVNSGEIKKKMILSLILRKIVGQSIQSMKVNYAMGKTCQKAKD